jgi:putative transposase
VYRIYRLLELKLRIKPKLRLVRHVPEPLAVTSSLNQVWSMVHAWLAYLRALASAVPCAGRLQLRGSVGIAVDLSPHATRVVRALELVIEWRGKPTVIPRDNRPEYLSGAMKEWSERRSIRNDYIEHGKPRQKTYVERYNRTVRYAWLCQHLFVSIQQVQHAATYCPWTYNNERPNITPGGITPRQKLAMGA